MSPVREPVALAGQRYRLRHIGPRARVWPTSPAANRSVLARTDMVARPLPTSDVPGSTEFVSGSWTTRLGDAGEATLLFPNTIATDGVPWRSRFDASGHCEFIEITDNGEVDFVGVIDKVNIDQEQVQVHCSDPWWLLKKAYERDWIVVQSPRDVIERATQVRVPLIADNFPPPALSSQWLNASIGGGSATIPPNGGLVLAAPSSGDSGGVVSSSVSLGQPSGAWSASCTASGTFNGFSNLGLYVGEDVHQYEIALFQGGNAVVLLDGTQICSGRVPTAPKYSLMIESDGEWIWAFVNGAFIGGFRRAAATTTTLSIELHLFWSSGSGIATISDAQAGVLQPFLQ